MLALKQSQLALDPLELQSSKVCFSVKFQPDLSLFWPVRLGGFSKIRMAMPTRTLPNSKV